MLDDIANILFFGLIALFMSWALLTDTRWYDK